MKLNKLLKILKKLDRQTEIEICGRPDLLFKMSDYNLTLNIIPEGLIQATFRTPVKKKTTAP